MQVIVGIISIAGVFITIGGVFIALMMLIRDMKRENTKVLKGIQDLQDKSLDVHKTALGIQQEEAQILAKIEEGQRRAEEGQRRGFETLAQILAKVEANTRA